MACDCVYCNHASRLIYFCHLYQLLSELCMGVVFPKCLEYETETLFNGDLKGKGLCAFVNMSVDKYRVTLVYFKLGPIQRSFRFKTFTKYN